MAILVKRDTTQYFRIIRLKAFEDGRAILVKADSAGSISTLVNVYCPNKEDTEL